MRRPILATVAALILAILTTGCGRTEAATSTGTPATAESVRGCTEYHKVVEEYAIGHPPERAALDKAVEEAYQGTGPREAVRTAMKAYWRAWAKALRAVANGVEKSELRAAIAAQADTYDRWADRGMPPNVEPDLSKSMAAALAICPRPQPTPS
jgi:hypothetical protein